MDEQPVHLGTVAELLRDLVNVVAARAWVALGLVPDPVTHHTAQNLDEARLAIDAAAALADLASPRLADSDRRDLQNLVATLRLNYVEQKTRAAHKRPEEKPAQEEPPGEKPEGEAQTP